MFLEDAGAAGVGAVMRPAATCIFHVCMCLCECKSKCV